MKLLFLCMAALSLAVAGCNGGGQKESANDRVAEVNKEFSCRYQDNDDCCVTDNHSTCDGQRGYRQGCNDQNQHRHRNHCQGGRHCGR